MIRTTVSVMLACGCASTVYAQQKPAPPVPVAFTSVLEFAPLQGPVSMGVVAVDALESSKPVLNAPYTAEAVTEVTQQLSDGNRIEQRTTATIMRDSRGRIRREQRDLALGAFVAHSDDPLVTITDPAAGRHLVLNYAERVAHQSQAITFPPVEAIAADGAPQRAPRPSLSVTPGPPVSQGTRLPAGEPMGMPRAVGAPEFGVTFELPAGISERAAGGVIATPAAPRGGRDQAGLDVRTETLPSQLLEGIRVEGTRTTTVISAGSMGNALPIEIISERWYSRDLQVVMMTRRSDPRFGETVYRLTNVVRAEPPADLFRVPPDFRVERNRR
jgi:hypothetical protein